MIVRHAVHISSAPSSAFERFTAGIGTWWPLDRFSYGGSRASGIYLEATTGGRFYERFTDGDELQVGEVLASDPPNRILFTWQAPGWQANTEIEVTFTPTASGGTRVEVEHRGFERLGPDGDTFGQQFDGGWPGVLTAYAAPTGPN
jgi:uncharacterized protein YndB with AHSA1/START domain